MPAGGASALRPLHRAQRHRGRGFSDQPRSVLEVTLEEVTRAGLSAGVAHSFEASPERMSVPEDLSVLPYGKVSAWLSFPSEPLN